MIQYVIPRGIISNSANDKYKYCITCEYICNVITDIIMDANFFISLIRYNV